MERVRNLYPPLLIEETYPLGKLQPDTYYVRREMQWMTTFHTRFERTKQYRPRGGIKTYDDGRMQLIRCPPSIPVKIYDCFPNMIGSLPITAIAYYWCRAGKEPSPGYWRFKPNEPGDMVKFLPIHGQYQIIFMMQFIKTLFC
jgi:hypothetical protein